jgi:hypothetical protein
VCDVLDDTMRERSSLQKGGRQEDFFGLQGICNILLLDVGETKKVWSLLMWTIVAKRELSSGLRLFAAFGGNRPQKL